MRITVNVDGKDILDCDVMDVLHMLGFQAGVKDFSTEPGTVVLVHVQAENRFLAERFVITEDEEGEE